MNQRALLMFASLAAVTFLHASEAHAWVYSGTGSADTMLIGLVRNGSTDQYRPMACLNDGTAVLLRGDSAWNEALNRDVAIDGGGGADDIYMVTVTHPGPGGADNGYQPGTSKDCGITYWYSINSYAGYSVSLDGGIAGDLLQGDSGTATVVFYGDGTGSASDGPNYEINHSSIGVLGGGNYGNDDLISDTTGGTDTLNGAGGIDCLWDYSNSFTTFNCGAGSDYRHTSNTGTTSCENTTSCCGLC